MQEFFCSKGMQEVWGQAEVMAMSSRAGPAFPMFLEMNLTLTELEVGVK